MENSGLIDNNLNTGSLTVSPQIENFLRETAKWAKFLAIVGFVFIGLIVLMGIGMGAFMGSMASSIPEAGGLAATGGGIIGTLYFLVIGALYFFPCLYLYRFATKMKTALASNDQAFLASSFENLKSCYKFMGILMAVVLAFYAFGIVIMLLLGGAAFM